MSGGLNLLFNYMQLLIPYASNKCHLFSRFSPIESAIQIANNVITNWIIVIKLKLEMAYHFLVAIFIFWSLFWALKYMGILRRWAQRISLTLGSSSVKNEDSLSSLLIFSFWAASFLFFLNYLNMLFST